MSYERIDRLTAQKVEVGLVFQQMLSTVEAEAYLSRSGVPGSVIARVLHQPAQRRSYSAGAFRR